jgi:hypothetical protein
LTRRQISGHHPPQITGNDITQPMNASVKPLLRRLASWTLTLTTLCCAVCAAESAGSDAVKQLFADPPREYSSGPLWVWNDLLTEAQIRGTMRDMATQKVRQVFVHPRPGLMTPYLGEEWFRLWKIALDEAERLDMNVWIYDENSYPSGFAGGWVPELMPESRGRGLHFREAAEPPKWDDSMLSVFRLAGGKAECVTEQVRAGQATSGERFLVAHVRRAGNSPWHGGRCYVDLLYPGVTEKFLEVTMHPYEREVGKHFGGRVPGVFTDEPELVPAGGWPWTVDLPEQFKKQWGYSLIENLASLNRPVGDWRRVRHNYFSTLNQLFIERWAKPYYEYCEERGLEFTGHYWEHNWPQCTGVPDNMAMAAWQQRPGIDILMNQYAEHTHAQFGNVRACREISSIASQLGRARTLVEVYGAGGWDLRFEDMKRIGDWLQVLGVNTLNEHLSYVTIRGARKNDHPQSFSYHASWWPAYHVIAEYFTRISAAMSQGEQINRVLLLEPTTTAWMYQGDGAKLQALGSAFSELIMSLEAGQIGYDLGSEDVIARNGSVENGQLRIGRRLYSTVVIPPLTENLDSRTWELFRQLRAPDGTVIACSAPVRKDGAELAGGDAQAEWKNRLVRARPDELLRILSDKADPGFRIERDNGDRGILFHNRRHLSDGQLLFLVNTSIEHPSAGRIRSSLAGIEQWDPATGKVKPHPFSKTGNGVEASFELPPAGSKLLFLATRQIDPAPVQAVTTTPLQPGGPLQIRRVEPNVLRLDYVDITAGGESRSNIYSYAAAQFAFQKNGLDRNPWDSAVQFKDELISKTFPAGSGFEASYRFTIEGDVPSNLAFVMERPDLYSITCNGKPLSAKVRSKYAPPFAHGGSTVEFEDWWLDKAFGRMEIAAVARTGENVITVTARPFTIWHELEAAYVLGDFQLKPVERGFVIAADAPPRILERRDQPAHSTQPDGTAWLSGGIGFQNNQGGAVVEDRQPFLIFDLGEERLIEALRIWNYNEGHVRDHTGRGARTIHLRASAAGVDDQFNIDFNIDLGRHTLERGTARSPGQKLKVPRHSTRFVRLDILSNHNGVEYPAQGDVADNGFAGLAEVQFFGPDRKVAVGVKIGRASSELASFNRRAIHLVDGSGFVNVRPGWNEQGHPFYAGRVSYQQTFQVASPQGKYVVALPDWHGSVAEVKVNGKSAGYILSAPWECDVTALVTSGANSVDVQVIGTPKNLLGPHHGNPPLGSAWPNMFRVGPDNGPPPGAQYHTIGYGLFEPFVLRVSR